MVGAVSSRELAPQVHRAPLLPLQPAVPRRRISAAIYGVAGAAGLLLFYLGLISLAQGWRHAVEQLAVDKWFIAAIATGFGTQTGLFTVLRRRHAAHHAAAAGGVAASTGTSAAAMLACCAHHLAEVFAVLGIAGAATFLTSYKVPLLWVGIGMNGAGIAYLIRELRRTRLAAPAGPTCHTPSAPVHTAPAAAPEPRPAPVRQAVGTPAPTVAATVQAPDIASRHCRVTIAIDGFTCAASEVPMVERALSSVAGVKLAYVNAATEMAYVDFDECRCTLVDLTKAVQRTGLRAGGIEYRS